MRAGGAWGASNQREVKGYSARSSHAGVLVMVSVVSVVIGAAYLVRVTRGCRAVASRC